MRTIAIANKNTPFFDQPSVLLWTMEYRHGPMLTLLQLHDTKIAWPAGLQVQFIWRSNKFEMLKVTFFQTKQIDYFVFIEYAL